MVSVFDVNPNEFIESLAQELKKLEEVKPPKWATFVKTGHFKERPPVRADWWYVRAAAVLRSIYKLGPVGVQKLRTKYGGKKGRGHKSEHFYKGSGNIIRKILQQLEKAGFIKQTQKGVHKGRMITPKGESFLSKLAKEISGGKKVEKKVGEEEKRKERGKIELKKEVTPKKEIKKEEKEEMKRVEELTEKIKEKGTTKEPTETKRKEKKIVEEVDLSKEKIEELAKEIKKKGTLRK